MISIIIPAYNQHDWTYDCITAVRKHTQDYELILVDNGSTPAFQKPYVGFVDCTLIRNETNLGFPVAVNQGIRAARGETIVLLNNDVIVTPGWAEKLLAAMSEYDIVGPATNYCAGYQRVQPGTYDSEEELNAVANEWAEDNQGETQEVNFVIGFLMMFKRSLYDEFGEFDESLWPCSGEEIDFCLRARASGSRIGIVAECYVHHAGSITFKDLNDSGQAEYAEIVKRNDAHLAEKWGDFWSHQLVERKDKVLLNLGCGRFPIRGKGFINIDMQEDLKPDMVADVLALPFEPGTVDEINAGHLLEHFDWVDGDKALRYWYHLLKPGGKIYITVPDYDVLCKRYLDDPTPESLREMNDLYIYSYLQKSPHKYAYSGALLKKKMSECGFTNLERMPIDHPYFASPVDWQVGYEGEKREYL